MGVRDYFKHNSRQHINILDQPYLTSLYMLERGAKDRFLQHTMMSYFGHFLLNPNNVNALHWCNARSLCLCSRPVLLCSSRWVTGLGLIVVVHIDLIVQARVYIKEDKKDTISDHKTCETFDHKRMKDC